MGLFRKLLYRLYYNPLKGIRNLGKLGVREYRALRKARQAFTCAALSLLESEELTKYGSTNGLRIFYLGSEKFLPLLLCSMYSIRKNTSLTPEFHILPDRKGFSSQFRTSYREFCRANGILSDKEVRDRMRDVLPQEKFPTLRWLSDKFALAKKIIDLNVADLEPKIFVDADTVFHRHPLHVEELAEHRTAFFQTDCQEAYCLPRSQLKSLFGVEVVPRCNTGLMYVDPKRIDWDWLERVASVLVRQSGVVSGTMKFHPHLEQTLYALTFSKWKDYEILNPSEYVVKPSLEETRNPCAVFHHHVRTCRDLFYRYGWQALLEKERPTQQHTC